jgi:toxin ParE1/3/4
MTTRKIVPREKAERDIDNAIDYYYGEGGADLALSFIDALESAFHHLAAHAESGSPRYAVELDLPGLRYWPLKQFPYLVFYVENDGRVDVWRVLHGSRDIPPMMQVADEE